MNEKEILTNLQTKTLQDIINKYFANPQLFNNFLKAYPEDITHNLKQIPQNLFVLKDYLDYININNSKEIYKLILKINKEINLNSRQQFYYLLKSLFIKLYQFNHQDMDNVAILLAKELQEICEMEKIPYSNIEINFNDLAFAQEEKAIIIRINNKYMKITPYYETFNIPLIPYFLKSINRQKLKIQNGFIYLIVTPRVDTNNISSEDVYELYKKIRALGYIWGDAAIRNVGRLLEDNTSQVPYENLSYTMALNEEIILKKGDLVALDTDYLYSENDPNIKYGTLEALKYEQRYQEEIKTKSI